MKSWLAATALFLLALLQEASAQEPVAEMPYRMDYGGAITVSVTIDGRGPYDFIIDTGATLTLAFQNLANIERFDPTGEPPRRVLGITGSSTLDTFRLGDVSLGVASLSDHIGVIVPDWAPPRKSPAGIIGLDFLRRYAVVFDVSSRKLTLYPHGNIPTSRIKDWKSVKLQANTYAAASGALYSTKGLVNRSPTTFLIDLGSGTTMINYRAAEAMFTSVISRDLGEGFTTGSRLKDVLLFLANIVMWSICSVFTLQASIVLLAVGMFVWLCLIPAVEAAEQTILQKVVPAERQGRVFGFAQSVEQAASPVTAFLIGPIAQLVIIPFMTTGAGVDLLGPWFGTGTDRGLALLFTAAGLIGLAVTLLAMQSPSYRALSSIYQKQEQELEPVETISSVSKRIPETGSGE